MYADERLDLLRRLRQAGAGHTVAQQLFPDGARLRARLGTSLADLRIPYGIAAELHATMARAANDLFQALCARHRAEFSSEEYDRLLMVDGFDASAVRPVSFVPPPRLQKESTKRAFLEATELHHGLDAGVLATWLGDERGGRELAGLLTRLFARAKDDVAATENSEPLVYLVLLMLRTAAPRAIKTAPGLPIAEPTARWIRGGVAAGMLVALRLALRQSGALGDSSPMALAVRAGGDLLPWLGGRAELPGSGLESYGIPWNLLPTQVDELSAKLASGLDPESLARDLATSIARDSVQRQRLERLCAQAVLRQSVRALLLVGEGKKPLPGTDTTLVRLFSGRELLGTVLGAAERRRELVAGLRAARTEARPEVQTLYTALEAGLRNFRDDEPGSFLGEGQAVLRCARAIVALAVDVFFDRALATAAALLLERTGGESEGGLAAEYEAGRLYFLAADDRSILRERQHARTTGHLFVDVKDFTRRTALLKEEVTADFLQRDFYAPILEAAREHHMGASHLDDRGGITLNNLLGDAVSFSGDISALMQLSRDIRRALDGYSKRLEQESRTGSVAERRLALEQRHVERQLGIDPALSPEARAAEERELDEDLSSDLALLAGEKLDAGIFLSYGAAPQVALFDDVSFGSVKVAIAEKINESARGTARTGAVRAKIDAQVAKARTERLSMEIVCPWSVLVDRSWVLPVPADALSGAQEILLRGDTFGAQAMLLAAMAPAVKQVLDASASGEAQAGDIYNVGCALSDEALRAYLAARDDRKFRRCELAAAALNPALQRRFVFPQTRLVLIAGFDGARLAELFVYSGRAMFKGFERQGGLAVWEAVPDDALFFSLLAQHHLPQLAAGGAP